MAIPATTKKYLDKKLTKYEAIAHKTVYTAYDVAQSLYHCGFAGADEN